MPIYAAVESVTITRAEGYEDELISRTFEGQDALALAKQELRRWAHTAPEGGCYDKCDFAIRWSDSSTYRGRYDLQRHSSGSLVEQVREHCSWCINHARDIGAAHAQTAQAILDGCDLED